MNTILYIGGITTKYVVAIFILISQVLILKMLVVRRIVTLSDQWKDRNQFDKTILIIAFKIKWRNKVIRLSA